MILARKKIRKENYMKQKILNDLLTQEEANDLTTEALIALEGYKYGQAIQITNKALKVSTNIEQRLALQMIKFTAVHHHDDITDEILEEAYKLNGGR